jgi:hypothetical protein
MMEEKRRYYFSTPMFVTVWLFPYSLVTAVFFGGHMLQCSLIVAWVVGATSPLPMVPFSRHRDNGLDGGLEFGCDMCDNSVMPIT